MLMKARNLLFMSALALVGTSANAAVTHRAKPVPQNSGVTVAQMLWGQGQYLYNPGVQGFFLGANDWGTRGSYADNGYKVFLSQHIGDDGAWDGHSVVIRDSVESQKAIKMWWMGGNDGENWVDWASQADTLWTITQNGENVRLAFNQLNADYENYKVDSIAKANGGSVFLGAKNGGEDTKLYWNLGATDSTSVDWYFVSLDGYKAYSAQLTVYQASEALYAQINAALAAGMPESSIASQEAVYNNENATVDELNAAAEAVKNAIAAYDESNVNTQNPKDESSFITNPSYESNSNSGWKGDAPGFQSYTDAEFYEKKFNTYQVIKGLPKGVYAVSVQAFNRTGWAGNAYTNYINNQRPNTLLYALVGKDTVSVNIVNPWSDPLTAENRLNLNESEQADANGNLLYIPNDMQSAEEYFKLGKYKNTLYFSVDADSTTIGLTKPSNVTADWVLFDNWSLTYYGKGTDAYSMWMKDMLSKTQDFSKLDTLVTPSVVEAYNTARNSYINSNPTTQEEVVEAYKSLASLADSVNTNISLWAQYQSAIQNARVNVVDNDGVYSNEQKDVLSDYVDGNGDREGGSNYVSIVADKSLTNDQLRAEIAWVNQTALDAVNNGLAPGTDVTSSYIKNANFEVSPFTAEGGWHETHQNGGNFRWTNDTGNGLFEAWNVPSFDVYQEVEGCPAGIYTISVQGFYRYTGGDQNSYNYYLAGTADQYRKAVQIYVNENTSNFKNIYDEHVAYNRNHTGDIYVYDADAGMGGNCVTPEEATGDSLYWFPNGMNNAARAFTAGLYSTSSYGVVAHDGDKLRIGVRGTTNQNQSWAIFDNFKMVYEGKEPAVVKTYLEPKIKEVQDTLANSNRIFGTDVIEKTNADVTAAQSVVNGNDGSAMFNSLSTLIADLTDLSNSANVLDSVVTYNDRLNQSIATYQETANESAIATATALAEEVDGHISAKDLTNAQAHDYIAKLQDAETALRLPKNYASATEDNPVDFTSMIVNPNYEAEGTNSFTGWTDGGPGNHSFGSGDNAAALLVEYFQSNFNVYQTITGLPDGYYKVNVHAFNRYGMAADDWSHFEAGDVNPNSAYLYAVGNGSDSTKVNLSLISAGAKEDAGETGTSKVNKDTQVVPNTMVSAHTWFADYNAYNNSVIVKVEGGKLTIGIRKDAHINNEWVILDTWTLQYLGTQTPTGIRGITVDNNGSIGAPVSTEIFNLSGARVNSLQKGVNIVRVKDAQGKTSVKKIIVK